MGVLPISASRESINGTLVLSEFYRDDWCPSKFGKRIYHALLSDWSVRYVADNDAAWTKWKTGQSDPSLPSGHGAQPSGRFKLR